jgi:hypothetical protein
VASGTLVIDADIPVIEAEQRPAGRDFIRLPDLEYNFELDPDCANGLLPKTISLSIADTRKSLSAENIPADSLTTTSLGIPAAQIGPIAVDNFCIAASEQDDDNSQSTDNQAGQSETLTISSVLSVQASLLCANETDSQITYTSKSLDVTLVCKASGAAQSTISN